VLGGYLGSGIPSHNQAIPLVTCQFTGETLTAIRALNPDIASIHAQKADRKGNLPIQGIGAIPKETLLASQHSIVTVEEIVYQLDAPVNACVLPSRVVRYVFEVPREAFPSYANGKYGRNIALRKFVTKRSAAQNWLAARGNGKMALLNEGATATAQGAAWGPEPLSCWVRFRSDGDPESIRGQCAISAGRCVTVRPRNAVSQAAARHPA
jgi:hypothetical protein